MTDYKKRLEEILDLAIKEDASDVHFSSGRVPTLRVHGSLVAYDKYPVLTKEDTMSLASVLMPPDRKEQFLSQRDVDLSYAYQDKSRFRVNIYHQLGQVSIAMRLIPNKIRTIDELSLPSICHNFAKLLRVFSW